MKQQRRLVKVTEHVLDNYNGAYTLQELIDRLTEHRDFIKDAVGEIKFEVELHEEWYPYDPNPSRKGVLQLVYDRIENDDEYRARTEYELKQKAAREAIDKAEYERLRKQFG